MARDPILNHTIANSSIFRTRLKDSVFGIYKSSKEFGWPESGLERIALGYTDLPEQIEFMREWSELRFELSLNAHELDVTEYLSDLSGLPNVAGLGGMGIPQEMFERFSALEHVFLGSECPKFDAGKHPHLTSIRGAFDEGTRGIENAPQLRKVFAALDGRKTFDTGVFENLGDLTHLRLHRGKIKNLDFLKWVPNLETLVLEKATQLTSIEGLQYIKGLKHMVIQSAKNVEDWEPLKHVSDVDEAMVLLSNVVNPPQIWKDRGFKLT